jgi:hypothetical protein
MKNFLGLILLLFSQTLMAFTVKFYQPVTPATVTSAMNAIEQRVNAGENELTLKLQSDGGEIPSAINLANYLRLKEKNGVRVTTYNGSNCSSSCTIIFAAGQIRKAKKSATFYFHSVGVEGAGQNTRDIQLQWATAWYYQVASVDYRLASDLWRNSILIGEGHERTYTASQLGKNGYTYVNQF